MTLLEKVLESISGEVEMVERANKLIGENGDAFGLGRSMKVHFIGMFESYSFLLLDSTFNDLDRRSIVDFARSKLQVEDKKIQDMANKLIEKFDDPKAQVT